MFIHFHWQNLGKEFVSPPTLNLMKVFKESGPLSPLIFIIMPGIDPHDENLGVTSAMKLDKFVKPYSLGRGSGASDFELLNEANVMYELSLMSFIHGTTRSFHQHNRSKKYQSMVQDFSCFLA